MEEKIINMKENFKRVFEWNYIPPINNDFKYEQRDWDMTLMTLINQMAATRVKYYNHIEKIRENLPLIVPNKFRELLLNFGVYYNDDTKRISNRFDVDFMDVDSNYIVFDGFKIKILNYNSPKNIETFKINDMENENKKEQIKKIVDNKDMTSTTGKGEGLRFNKGKLRYDLVEPRAHRDMVKVLTYGASKYFDRNWENGLGWSSIIASAKRHLAAIEQGEDYDFDPECDGCKSGDCKNHSGELHVANLACNAHFLNAFYYTFPQGDDRPKRFLKLPKIGLDIDGVLADFTTAWNEVYPEIEINPSTYYFDKDIMARFKKMTDDGTLDKLYLNLKPLISPSELPFEPHCYVTARPVDTEITKQWLASNGFPNRKVITVPTGTSKVDALKEAGIEIFIDDYFGNFVELNNAGIFTYLFTSPWNEKYDVGHMRLNSLKDLPLQKK